MMAPLTNESLKEDIEEIKRDLKSITHAISTIAVQDERIKHVEVTQATLWNKHDSLECKIDSIGKYQASCPRNQIKLLWIAIIPQALVLLGMFLELIRLAHEIAPK